MSEGSRQFGVTSQNPILIEDSEMRSFGGNWKGITSTALGVRRSGPSSLFTGASNITWTNVPQGNRFFEHRPDSRQLVYRDYTGSITSHNNASLVRSLPHLLTDQCTPGLPQWGPVSVCPLRYISLPITGKINIRQTALTRDDIPTTSFTPVENDNYYYLSTAHSFILSFVEVDFPVAKMFLQPRGVDAGVSVRFGVCLPLGSTVTVARHEAVDAIEKLEEDPTAQVYFHDKAAGVIFFKFLGTYERKPMEMNTCGADGTACFTGRMTKVMT